MFEDVEKIQYTIDENGLKIPYSDFDRPVDYYDKMKGRTYSDEEYISMCRFKDKGTALFDKRWKSSQAVINMIAEELEIDVENCGLWLYALNQNKGKFESPLVEKIKDWFDKSGDKVKLKKRIAELEKQIEVLKATFAK